jgi:hypothetical protein
MASLIEQLQQDAVDRTVRASDLLRKALLVAAKLEIPNVPSWIESELSGYAPSEKWEEELPSYRIVTGRVMALNPMQGWQTVMFNDAALERKYSRRPVIDPIGKVEALLEGSKASLQATYPPETEVRLRKAIGMQTDVGCHVTRASIAGILDEVRNKVLLWSIELDRAGIRGDGISFTREEKEKAHSITIHAESGSVKADSIDLSDIRVLISELEKHKETLARSGADKDGLESTLGDLKAAVAERAPQPRKIAKVLQRVKDATASAGKSAVKVGIDALAEAAMRQIIGGS